MTDEATTQELTLSVDEFRQALAGAAWAMNLHDFCAALGWPADQYAKQKFLRFQDMATSMGQFDLTVLTRLIEAQRAYVARAHAAADRTGP